MKSVTEGRIRGLRRSKLLAKGGTWEVIAEANDSIADIVHIELESGFADQARPAAVEATCRALAEMDWSGKEAWVRFRHIDETGTREEISLVMAGRPHLVYCAKVKTADDIRRLDEAVTACESRYGIDPGSTQIGAVIERIEALYALDAIVSASPRMGAIMFGANDMSLDVGYRRSGVVGENPETLYIRSRMVLAGRLAKIDVLDAAWTNWSNIADSAADAQFSARMGFTGKTALKPAQLAGIHDAFKPSARELAWAEQVVAVSKLEDEHLRIVDGDRIDSADVAWASCLMGRA
jgi:citrate lyase subunit beta/citryl-CoA lyase